jgi:hypothetical protein
MDKQSLERIKHVCGDPAVPEHIKEVLGGIEANSEEEAIENFIIENIGADWITQIEIVSVKLLSDNLQEEMQSE